MNHKALFTTGTFIALAGCFIVSPQLLNDLFALIFTGVIPFTNFTIPPIFILFGYPLIIVAIILWLARQPLFIHDKTKQDRVYRSQARKKVIKQTTTPQKQQTRRHYRRVEA